MGGDVKHPEAELEENLARLRGERFSRVEYFHSDDGWPRDYRLDTQVHEPDTAVRFDAVSGERYLVTWEMRGEEETLVVRIGARAEPAERFTEGVDVSGVDPWPGLLGRPVVDALALSSGWSDACIRVVFDAGSIDVSLGEWQDGRLVYLPTSLVVEFDMSSRRGDVS